MGKQVKVRAGNSSFGVSGVSGTILPVEWERQIGIPRKWVVYFLGPLLVYAFYPDRGVTPGFPICYFGLTVTGSIFLLYTLLVHYRGEWRPRAVWYAGIVAELAWLGALVFYSGGLESPLTILYALTLLGVAVSQPRAKDFIVVGLLAHLSYTLALYFYYSSFSFYTSLLFWLICLTLGLVFLASIRVVTLLETSLKRAREVAAELEAKNRRLEELAVSDELTGLYNYSYFRRRLQEELGKAGMYGDPVSLLILDIDDFRSFDEKFGYVFGNEALGAIAALILRETRVGDVVCRYGGDEFAVILPKTGRDEACALATNIVETIGRHNFAPPEAGEARHISMTAGVATYPVDARGDVDLINRAENALFAARQVGGERVQCYHNVLEELRAAGVDEGEQFWASLETLITVINAKDKYTRGHSERVAELVMALAREIGLSEEETRVLGYAGFLHDIGKIEIDRRVLNKEGPLTDEEWNTIKQHPLYGATIVEPLPRLKDLVPVIRHHHERFDGRGYPDGLKGFAIPLGARIMALADSYDAMRSNRPYRQAMTVEEALAEVKRCAGTQFDPGLVGPFIKVVREQEMTSCSAHKSAAGGDAS